MSIFKLYQPYQPAGDQPKAIAELSKLLKAENKNQTLLGVTGSGKTFTIANVIANLGRPALVISHNKNLAAQLYQEFKTFFQAMRHATTATALTRRDFIIVASVSCIYGIGDPEEYEKASLEIRKGTAIAQRMFLRKLVQMQYERNDYDKRQGTFSARGEAVEIVAPSGNSVIRIEWDGNRIEKISEIAP